MLRLTLFLLVLSMPAHAEEPFLTVLGVAQDAGSPHIACTKSCCAERWGKSEHLAISIALVDPQTQRRWIFDASPDFPHQLAMLDAIAPPREDESPRDLGIDGIFLTHAHIGHYTGIMYLGREASGAKSVPVYAMPRMTEFLRTNGPWSQLVSLENIELRAMQNETEVDLGGGLSVMPIRVPHRDEYSETVGFYINGPNRSALFIPDINKWEKWTRSLAEELTKVDLAYVDATFFDADELPGRDMSEIPHPFVVETLQLVADLPAAERAKLRFIHFNHSNPLLRADSEASQVVKQMGCGIAITGEREGL